MKKNIIYLLIVFMSSSVASWAQNNSESATNQDKWVRAAMVYEDDDSFKFNTNYGKAAANLVIKAHKELLPYPGFSFNQSNHDFQTYVSLVEYLEGLRENPPTWEALIEEEEEKIVEQNAPPTAPVYAGDQAAHKYLNERKGSNGLSRKFDSVGLQVDPGNQSTSDEPRTVIRDVKTNTEN